MGPLIAENNGVKIITTMRPTYKLTFLKSKKIKTKKIKPKKYIKGYTHLKRSWQRNA